MDLQERLKWQNLNKIVELDNAPNMGYLVTICYITVTKCGTNSSTD